jgi:hypothetical protein|nr:MAG TPA: hypothetical protein [Caudoviricetes sp.]
MERLTDYSDDECTYIIGVGNKTCEAFCKYVVDGCKNCYIQQVFKKLADYEDLEEQGLLVRLPDDLNRILYQVNYRWKCTEYGEENNKCEIYDCKCECDIRKEYYIAEVDLQYISIKSYYNCLGEFLFLTREAAEKKLEEMKKND